MVLLVDDVLGFAERFGVEVWSIYNMTEVSARIIAGPNPTLKGSCGRVRPGVDLRLVDEHDIEVPVSRRAGRTPECFSPLTASPWPPCSSASMAAP